MNCSFAKCVKTIREEGYARENYYYFCIIHQTLPATATAVMKVT